MKKMTPAASKLYNDDFSLLMVLFDTNPFFWNSINSTLSFSKFLSNVLAFLNSILLLNQLNQVVLIATGYNSCDYIFDSSASQNHNQRAESPLQKLEEFVENDESLCSDDSVDGPGFSLLSGSLSMAFCYIQEVFRSGPLHPRPWILCLQGSPDGPGQYVAIMNAIFSAQRSMVHVDSCILGAQHSAFLQQDAFFTAGFLYNWWCISLKFWMGFFCICQQFLQRICILAAFYNFLSLWGWTFVHRAFATKTQLTWATYVLYVCRYSASITRNVQPVGQSLVGLKHGILTPDRKRETSVNK